MKISYDARSFMIDGERRLFLSGELHYFRLPRTEWKQALVLAQQAGLNAISTYIPWNFHEPQEGKWNFKDDHDLEAFLKLCKQHKLYVIAKPGPFIRSGWTFGGFPPWLHAKGVKHFRTSDISYMNAVDKYLDKVLGLLAKYQVNKGGPVFLIQIEDTFDEAPQDPAYLRHLEHKFKKRVTVPLYFSLGDTSLGGGQVRGALVAAVASSDPARKLLRLRELANHSRQPIILSQFLTGQAEVWGQPKQEGSTRELLDGLTQALGCGASLLNISMFVGGTNFNDQAGRATGSDTSFMATRHEAGAPISEGLKKTPKALALGLWARWARGLAPSLLGSELLREEHPVIPSEAQITARGNGDARIYFIKNPGTEPMSGKIQVDEAIPFTLAPGEERVYAYNIPLTPNLSVRGSSHPYYYEQLGTRTVVVLWGEPGQKIQFFGSGTLDVTEKSNESILLEHERKGFTLTADVDNRPQKLAAKILFENSKREILFLILTRSMAEQSSFDADKGRLVIGSADVDFTARTAVLAAGPQTVINVTESGDEESYIQAHESESRIQRATVTGVLGEEAMLKRLESRKDWQEAVAGKDLAEYGFTSTRAWYRVNFTAKEKGKKVLILPRMEDQFAVFHLGQSLGLYGRMGKGPKVELIVKPGPQTLYLLCADWGRYQFGTKLGDKKGLILPIFDGGEVQDFADGWHFLEAAGPLDFKIFSSPTFVGRGWEIGALPKTLERSGYVCARKKFKVPDWAKRVRLDLHAGDVNIEVALNGQYVGLHPDKMGSGYVEFELTPYLISGENTVTFFFKGPTTGFQHSELLFLGPELKAKMDICEGAYAPHEVEALKDKGWSKTKKAKLGFWRATFKSVAAKDLDAAWLKLSKTGRGSLWLNGQSLGRHHKVGPQDTYKLPVSWLKPINELLVLEEESNSPGDAQVLFELKPETHKIF